MSNHRLTPFQHGLLRGAAQNGGTVPPWLYRNLKPRARRSFDILATRGYFARDGEGGLFLTETGKTEGARGYTWIKGNSERATLRPEPILDNWGQALAEHAERKGRTLDRAILNAILRAEGAQTAQIHHVAEALQYGSLRCLHLLAQMKRDNHATAERARLVLAYTKKG